MFPSYIDAWKGCEVAEDKGFSHTWLYETQMLCVDVWATMALGDVYEGHMIYLKPGEDQFVPSAALPVLSLVGSPEQVLTRVRQYRDVGADNLALQVIPGTARDLIEEFSEHVIAKL